MLASCVAMAAVAGCADLDGGPAGLDTGGAATDAEANGDPNGDPDSPPETTDVDVDEIDEPDTRPDADLDAHPDASEPDAPEVRAGSWEAPIVISSLPFSYSGDTRAAPSDTTDRYACAPDTDESGGEFVFLFAPAAPVRVRVEVDDVRGDDVDVDVHLLAGATCVTRHDVMFVATVGDAVHIVVDTWVNGGGDVLAGPFTLRVTAAPTDPGDCLTNPIECDEGDLPTPNGVPVEPAGLGGCPDGMAPVAAYCVDRWEAALVTASPVGPWSPYANPGDVAVRAVSAPGLVPQGYITGVQAGRACERAGKRLCTDDEWLRACQGAAGKTFPYGATHEPGRCNEGRVCHPVVQYFESGADWIWSELGHPCINQLPDGLATTGSHPGCASDDGIFDLHGNLHEWTANPTGIFRGGFYVDARINGAGCLYRTTAHTTGHWDYSTGFRCCADAR